MTPSTLPIVLRCGPSGPPFDLAAAVAALGVSGNVTRIWNTPHLPDDDINIEVETAVLLQTIDVDCDASQLGRCYIAWWHLLLEPELECQDPETQPTEAHGIIEAGSTDFIQQDLYIGVKLHSRETVECEPDVFPWLADGDGSVLIVPGTTCAPFVVGVNTIKFLAMLVGQFGRADMSRSCLTVIELALTAAEAVRVAPSEPAI